MDLSDQVSQPRMADGSRRRRQSPQRPPTDQGSHLLPAQTRDPLQKYLSHQSALLTPHLPLASLQAVPHFRSSPLAMDAAPTSAPGQVRATLHHGILPRVH